MAKTELMTVKVPSATIPGDTHDVTVYEDGSMYCRCNGWKFSHAPKGCSHTEQVGVRIAVLAGQWGRVNVAEIVRAAVARRNEVAQ